MAFRVIQEAQTETDNDRAEAAWRQQPMKDMVVHHERPPEGQVRYIDLQKAADALTAAADRQDDAQTELATVRYVGLVWGYSQGRIDVMRGLFLPTLFFVLARIERRYPMRTDARDQFAEDLVLNLEEAESLHQLVENFKHALQRLCVVASKAVHGPKAVRLEAALQYLRRNFTERLRLPEVARKAGFSVPSFVRSFKEATGMPFLPFVRALRVEFTKTLLTTTHMNMEEIALRSGFQTQHNLNRSFKKLTGSTPSAYRNEHGIKSPDDLARTEQRKAREFSALPLPPSRTTSAT